MKCYLIHRKLIVENNENCSDLKSISKSVPQGSILGPLLFIAYINDQTCIDPDAKYVLYADDVSIFVSAEDSITLQEKKGTRFLRN